MNPDNLSVGQARKSDLSLSGDFSGGSACKMRMRAEQIQPSDCKKNRTLAAKKPQCMKSLEKNWTLSPILFNQNHPKCSPFSGDLKRVNTFPESVSFYEVSVPGGATPPSLGWGLIVMVLALTLWGAGCAHRPSPAPDPTPIPSKASIEALIERCENLPETQEVRCPLDVFLKSLNSFVDLWECSERCGAHLRACQRFGAVDRAELTGRVQQETARADRNARWAWIVAGVGGLLTVVGFVLGAAAF